MYPITKMLYDSHSSFVENPAQNKMYINGKEHDAVTLTPYFDSYSLYSNTLPFCGIAGFQFNKAFRCGATYLRDYSIMSCQGHHTLVGENSAKSGYFEYEAMYNGGYKHVYRNPSNYRDFSAYVTPQSASIDASVHTVSTITTTDYAVYARAEAANPGSYAGICSMTSGATALVGVLNTTYGAHATATILYEDSTNLIYVYSSGHTGAGTGKAVVCKLVKATAAVSALASLDNAGAASGYSPMQSFSKPITIGDYVYMLVAEGTNNGILLVKYQISAGTATITRKTVSFTANGGSNPFVDSGSGVGVNTRWRDARTQILLITSGGNYYFATLCCRNNTGGTSITNASYYQLNVFTIPSNNFDAASYTYNSKIVFNSGETPYGMLDLTDKQGTKIAIVCNADVRIYTFSDSPTVQYTLSNTLSITTRSIGVDYLNRLWIMDNNVPPNVYVIAPGQTVRINIAMQSVSYNYTGSNINTNLVVSAIDDTGAKVAKNVTLTIERGNLEFAGGAKTTNVTTNAGSDLNVSVTITGGGQFSITATEIA